MTVHFDGMVNTFEQEWVRKPTGKGAHYKEGKKHSPEEIEVYRSVLLGGDKTEHLRSLGELQQGSRKI